MDKRDYVLVEDCHATLIPAGTHMILEKGTEVSVQQSLGGALTVRAPHGLYRIEMEEIKALGAEAKALYYSEIVSDSSDDTPFSEELIWNALRQCYDPEIPLNIVDLGLIYSLKIEDSTSSVGKKKVHAVMTLTAVGCGMGPTIASDARAKIESLSAVEEADVVIVWDPPWNPHMISEEGRKILGLD